GPDPLFPVRPEPDEHRAPSRRRSDLPQHEAPGPAGTRAARALDADLGLARRSDGAIPGAWLSLVLRGHSAAGALEPREAWRGHHARLGCDDETGVERRRPDARLLGRVSSGHSDLFEPGDLRSRELPRSRPPGRR